MTDAHLPMHVMAALLHLRDGRHDEAERALRPLPAEDLTALARLLDDASAMCLALAGPSGPDGIPGPVVAAAAQKLAHQALPHIHADFGLDFEMDDLE